MFWSMYDKAIREKQQAKDEALMHRALNALEGMIEIVDAHAAQAPPGTQVVRASDITLTIVDQLRRRLGKPDSPF